MRFLIIPGVIAAFSIAVICAAVQLDLSPPMIVGDSLQPRVFPILLMVINLILAALLASQYRKESPGKVQGRLPDLGFDCAVRNVFSNYSLCRHDDRDRSGHVCYVPVVGRAADTCRRNASTRYTGLHFFSI